MSKEPLSIEILLQKQKEQREAAAKVVFFSEYPGRIPLTLTFVFVYV
jgi:hypothetical protein